MGPPILKQEETLPLFAREIRRLSRLSLITSKSGHAGLPFGTAELGAYLFGKFLHLSPKNPTWLGRDRFVLSAGHGSLLLYCALHLIGFDISERDLQNYRTFGSKTPSHPDIRRTAGVEATTGLDGQGIGYTVGMALGMKINQSRFDRLNLSLFDVKCIVLAGDGCLMEGVSSECCSLAGHLSLSNLIVIYDSNKTSLDGYTSETFSEDTKLRFQAYHWDVFEVDGYDFEKIDTIFSALRKGQKRPALIIAHTVTGKGLEEVEGTPLAHGNPYASVLKHKQENPNSTRDVDSLMLEHFLKNRQQELTQLETLWLRKYTLWKTKYPDLETEFLRSLQKEIPITLSQTLDSYSFPSKISGRNASHRILNLLASELHDLYGGSADLSRSDKTYLDNYSSIQAHQFSGRNIKFGVREFGMCTIAVGMSLTGLIRPFIGTFLSFSDYMISGIRMAALMKQNVIFQLTHDSFLVGHDGPTHQPVEHIAHLRAIPTLLTIRPADGNEVKMAWLAALNYSGPVAILLSRHKLPMLSETNKSYSDGVGKGGYILQEDASHVDFLIIATGSEVSLSLRVASRLREAGYTVRLVSMPCQELFDQQKRSYQNAILNNSEQAISIEAGVDQGWHKYIGKKGIAISIGSFGESGSPGDLSMYYEFTEKDILRKIGICCE